MQIPIPCLQCWKPDQKGFVYALADIDDAGCLKATCENGHSILTVETTPKHEWLTTSGALAFCNGYYRESVSTFAAALEKSFEFYIEVALWRDDVAFESVRGLLNANKADQRRAGMVSLCYLRDTSKLFPYLQYDRIKFRNDVIHNGHWPTRSSALEYAGYVCGAIRGLYDVLGPEVLDNYDEFLMSELIAQKHTEMSTGTEQFLDFFMRSATIEGAIEDFRKGGPHKQAGLRALR